MCVHVSTSIKPFGPMSQSTCRFCHSSHAIPQCHKTPRHPLFRTPHHHQLPHYLKFMPLFATRSRIARIHSLPNYGCWKPFDLSPHSISLTKLMLAHTAFWLERLIKQIWALIKKPQEQHSCWAAVSSFLCSEPAAFFWAALFFPCSFCSFRDLPTEWRFHNIYMLFHLCACPNLKFTNTPHVLSPFYAFFLISFQKSYTLYTHCPSWCAIVNLSSLCLPFPSL